MTNILISIGMMSLQASVIIAVVLLIRKLFSLAGIAKKYMMMLWVIPFFFLIFPWKISVDSGFWKQAPVDYAEEYEESGNTSIFNEDNFQIVGNTIVGTFPIRGEENKNQSTTVEKPTPSVGENQQINADSLPAESKGWKLADWMMAGTIVWLIGVVGLFLHSGISCLRLKKQLCFSLQEKDSIYRADNIEVPMVFGIVRPKIYVPSDVEHQYMEYVVEHEKTHIYRKDPITKMIMYFIVCLHWFNPLVWVAYVFMVKDMEMTCDEETLQRIGLTKKKQYATALLELSCGKNHILAVPLAFAEGDSKRRIKNVLTYKKTVMAAAVVAVLATLLITTFFLTKEGSPKGPDNNITAGANVSTEDSNNNEEEKDKEQTSSNQGNTSSGKEEDSSSDSQGSVSSGNQDSSSSSENEYTPIGKPDGNEDASTEEAGSIDTILQQLLKEEYVDRALTAEEIQWFNEGMFQRPEDESKNMAFMFLATYYSSPEKIDLYDLFREGTGTGARAGAEELAALEQIVDENKKWLLEMDNCKSPVSEMEQILNQYMGLSVSDCGTEMSTFFYLEEYDAYYTFHGDTSYHPYQMHSGYLLTDGSVVMIYYTGWDYWTQASDPMSDIAIVTLKKVEEGRYYFESNLRYEN